MDTALKNYTYSSMFNYLLTWFPLELVNTELLVVHIPCLHNSEHFIATNLKNQKLRYLKSGIAQCASKTFICHFVYLYGNY